jgi:hypothetical protein
MTREQKLATFTALTKLAGIKTGRDFEESFSTARLLIDHPHGYRDWQLWDPPMSQASSISNPLSGSITTPTATLGLRFTSAFTRASSPGSTETRAALVSLVIAAAAHGENFVSLAVRLWQNELLRVSPPLMSPAPAPRLLFGSRYPWHSVTSSGVQH